MVDRFCCLARQLNTGFALVILEHLGNGQCVVKFSNESHGVQSWVASYSSLKAF